MAWVEPVTDRTQADIDGGTAKAYYNADDLNRIEEDCAYLADVFDISVSTRTWARTDFPAPADFVRILGNVDALRAAYHTYQTTPQTPENPVNDWHKANAIEQILYDLNAFYADNARAVTYAGELYAGQTIGVI